MTSKFSSSTTSATRGPLSHSAADLGENTVYADAWMRVQQKMLNECEWWNTFKKNELRLNIFQFPMFPGNYGIIHFDLLILSHVQFRFHRSPPIERVFRMHLGHRPPSQAAAKTWSDHTIHRQKTTVYIVYIVYIYHILIYDSDLLILYLHYKQTNDIYHIYIYIIHSISHDASLSSVFSIILKNSHLVQPTTSKRSSHQHSQTLPGSL